MTREIFVSTGNAGKVKEISRLLGGKYSIKWNRDFPNMAMPEEAGSTFADNASIKAMVAANHSGMLALADDSGLVVDALGGEPGVRTARYGGDSAMDDRGRYMLLLRNMKDVPEGKRSARFVCAVALALPGKLLAVTEGVCEGSIAFEPRGENGFGYDPVFVPQGYNRSFAELGSNEKDRISHRSKALAAMYPIVEEQFAAADKGV